MIFVKRLVGLTEKDPKYLIGRIIARPYVGEPGNFTRTSNRHDYALKPFGKTIIIVHKKSKLYNTSPNQLKN